MIPTELRAELAKIGAKDSPAAQRIAKRVRTRQCGPCRACCTLKGVDDLEPPKPANVPCASLCGLGCARYANRPLSCRTYLCAWRLGLGGSEARPDRCGVVVDLISLSEHNPGVNADFDGALTIRSGGQTFAPKPVVDMILEAWDVGPFYVAVIDPEADRAAKTVKFEGDPRRAFDMVCAFAASDRNAPGSWRPRVEDAS